MLPSSQTIQKNIQRAASDPLTRKNAAKADERLHDKKKIADPSRPYRKQTQQSEERKAKKDGDNKNPAEAGFLL